MTDAAAHDLRLRPLRLGDEAAARAAHAELAADGFSFLLDFDPGAPWAEHLALHERLRRGDDLPANRVRAAFLVAEAGGELVGRASVRFTLNDYLKQTGGHVGYGVRPAFRRRGHAGTILRQALVLLRADGVDRVLVTCDEGNVGSARVIEGAGGIYEDTREDRFEHTAKRRYWIS
jgi:predicted acetyltransferase